MKATNPIRALPFSYFILTKIMNIIRKLTWIL
jgi:hypothetical protein